jgi:hypothetical protein
MNHPIVIGVHGRCVLGNCNRISHALSGRSLAPGDGAGSDDCYWNDNGGCSRYGTLGWQAVLVLFSLGC